MAEESVIINKVRRNLRDFPYDDTNDNSLSDPFYQDAIEYALQRINSDTCNAYSLSTFPSNWEWILVILATLNMLNTKLTYSGNTPNGSLKRLEVEKFEVEYHANGVLGANDLIRYRGQLESQYDKFLDKFGCGSDLDETLSDAITLVTQRTSLRRQGGLRHYNLDKGINPPSDFALTDSGGKKILTWTPIYNQQFYAYRLQRLLPNGDWFESSDVKTLVIIYDNHTKRFIDKEVLSPGNYEYRISLLNKNRIEVESDPISFTQI